MEVSPKTLREVEFREKMRGYHPEDVDHFLEQVAAGIEVLQDRLRQAMERAQRAEAAAASAAAGGGGNVDETLRKTLVLAQRTADMAVQEAREQASRILASAEQKAQAVLAEADDKGRRVLEDAVKDAKSELVRLETSRSQAQQDVDTLQRWLDEHKAHLQSSLQDALAAVERAGVLWPAPSTRTPDAIRRGPERSEAPPEQWPPSTPPPPSPSMGGPAPAPSPSPGVPVPGSQVPRPDPSPAWQQAATGPETVVWNPPPEARPDMSATVNAPPASAPDGGPGQAPRAADESSDDFYDDGSGYADDRRSGGRLFRRR